MKKLTLDETWKQCLKMWRWIVRQLRERPYANIGSLKREWLDSHGFGDVALDSDCFFCEWADGDCGKCPGVKVRKDFECMDTDYDFANEPAAFLREITRLNKIRLAKKRK